MNVARKPAARLETRFVANGAIRTAYHDSVLADLAHIGCRTTVIVGVDDVPFVEPSARLAATIPNARLVRIADAAHCPQYENADDWRAAVEAHLG